MASLQAGDAKPSKPRASEEGGTSSGPWAPMLFETGSERGADVNRLGPTGAGGKRPQAALEILVDVDPACGPCVEIFVIDYEARGGLDCDSTFTCCRAFASIP